MAGGGDLARAQALVRSGAHFDRRNSCFGLGRKDCAMAGGVREHRSVLVDKRHRAVVERVTPASWWVAAAIVERWISVETPAVEVRIPNPAVRIELEGHSHAGGGRAGQ